MWSPPCKNTLIVELDANVTGDVKVIVPLPTAEQIELVLPSNALVLGSLLLNPELEVKELLQMDPLLGVTMPDLS